MAARIFFGGELDGRTDTIWDQDRGKHPKIVLVYVWEPNEGEHGSYHVKTYVQSNPEGE